MAFDYLKYTVEGIDKPAVLRELIEAYGKDVWNYAFLLTLRTHEADDVMQDVFVKTFERLDSFRGESSIKTWLFAITRNTVLDRQRSAWIRKVTLSERPAEERSGANRSAGASAEQEALGRFLQQDIWREVMKLSPKLREVLLLAAHHGFGAKEIAELLGVAEGTVKSRLSRARDKVDRMLKEGERE